MADKKHITPEEHRRQIEAYTKVRPCYVTYARTLDRLLRNACAVSFPEAFIQSRAKTVSSFAEKCARKFGKYPDAVNQMTDLCGARVIVQTTEQVKAVRQFIEANFVIVEKEDKGVLLKEDEFGYRDMHYIVELCADRCDALGITADERKEIGQKRAEIQVRTWVQHAWADTLHDRMYKNKLKISTEIVRTGALLAALMEEGDRTFNEMADELDGMIANYTAYASKDEVQTEVKVQELILGNERDAAKKPGLALKLARLLAACGDHARVVELLEPHADLQDANRCELLQELGYGLCRLHRKAPASAEYERGCALLEEALGICRCEDVPFVPHLRKRESLHARGLVRLGWALEALPGQEHKARDCYHQAYEHEPSNPYYLAEMLGFEMFCSRKTDLPSAIRATLREAVKTCRTHAETQIELPAAYFTAGRLSLLLDQSYDALGYYARGIRHVLDARHCFPADVADVEKEWVRRLYFGQEPTASAQAVLDLFALAARVRDSTSSPPADAPKAMILAGGAVTMDAQAVAQIRPLVEVALEPFKGRVISGGTTVGVPGCAGEVAAGLKARGAKGFELVGYIPRRLPHDAEKDKRYDRIEVRGESGFSPEQVLRSWSDLLAADVRPQDVLCLGFGGGLVSAFEYRVALGLGATVAVVPGKEGDAADRLIKDPLWADLPNLFPLPPDSTTVRALVVPPERKFDDATLTRMAMAFHENYVAGSSSRLPDNMKPWGKLKETFKKANAEQARYSVMILKACGFGVRPAENPVLFDARQFTDEEVERMAEMEHGRWNAERLRDGWRHGARDDARKTHNCLIPWRDLPDGPEGVKHYDREAVGKYPEILAKAGLEVYRL